MREGNLVDFLREGLGLQDNSLTKPVPNCDGVIRVTTNRGELGSTVREFNMGVKILSTHLQNAIELQ
jgi:hypothetical protein